jgi:circadian clock protein KaiC
LNQVATSERISTGIDRLDTMFSGKGYYKGSNVLVSGTAGTGKTSLAAHFVDSVCSRNERALYLCFEESPSQIIRNMKSIGIDLEKWVKKGLLQFRAVRPTLHGLELHLMEIHRLVDDFKPAAVVIDPMSNLIAVGNSAEVKSMLARLLDYLKGQHITTVCTDLTSGGEDRQQTDVGISSIADTWILLRLNENGGERNRTLYIAKSRGMEHSEQIREIRLTDNGLHLLDVYTGAGGVLIGSARLARENQYRSEALARRQKLGLMRRDQERKQTLFQAEIAALQAKYEYEQEEIQRAIDHAENSENLIEQEKAALADARKVDVRPPSGKMKKKAGSK